MHCRQAENQPACYNSSIITFESLFIYMLKRSQQSVGKSQETQVIVTSFSEKISTFEFQRRRMALKNMYGDQWICTQCQEEETVPAIREKAKNCRRYLEIGAE